MRRALKNIKEAIPELQDTIMAFETDYIPPTPESNDDEVVIEVDGVNNIDVDLFNLTDEQQQDVKEMMEIYKQNPANATLDAEKIKSLYEQGKPINEIRNEFYAEIVNLSKSKNTYPLVENVIKGVPYEKSES